MRKQLQNLLEKRVQQCVSSMRNEKEVNDKIEKKKGLLRERSAEIVKAKVSGRILETKKDYEVQKVMYQAHYQYLIRQKDFFYIEEEVENRVAEFYKKVLVQDTEINQFDNNQYNNELVESDKGYERFTYQYDRLKAVQYAEKWWNSYNPAFKSFEVDCTNFISQCLFAGGAPMRGYPSRNQGWWVRGNNWSYSWAVANALRIHLANSNIGLRAKEVKSPKELMLGDIICYDFEGDGRFNHNTIVTAKDSEGYPLVNAHTTNSRMRYWSYEDSTAYTPNIKYKFFSILDDQ